MGSEEMRWRDRKGEEMRAVRREDEGSVER